MTKEKMLSDISCYKCGMQSECLNKIKRSPRLMEICEAQMNKEEYEDCGIYIALTCPCMEDTSNE